MARYPSSVAPHTPLVERVFSPAILIVVGLVLAYPAVQLPAAIAADGWNPGFAFLILRILLGLFLTAFGGLLFDSKRQIDIDDKRVSYQQTQLLFCARRWEEPLAQYTGVTIRTQRLLERDTDRRRRREWRRRQGRQGGYRTSDILYLVLLTHSESSKSILLHEHRDSDRAP